MPEQIQASATADVAGRFQRLCERIAAAAQRSGRNPEDIHIVGVCKGQPLVHVVAALEAGLTCLGENYVQEARRRRAQIEALGHQGVQWACVGRLQSNKAQEAATLFDIVESVDRFPLAVELERRARVSRRPLEVLVQVNLSGEAQKGGVSERELPELVTQCASLPGLRLRGLMTIPACSPDLQSNRPAFARLREWREILRCRRGGEHLSELSMGMSGDFEVAIEEGATRIRIGTLLFGPRPARKGFECDGSITAAYAARTSPM